MTEFYIKGESNQSTAREMKARGLWPKELMGEYLDNSPRKEPVNELMEHLANEFFDGFDH